MKPSSIDRYQVESIIASGELATLYRCRDAEADRVYAIKLFRDGAFKDDRDRQWFLERITEIAGLDHPRILPIYRVGTRVDGTPFLVMQYASRGSLADRVEERIRTSRRFSVREALEISLAIAEGVAEAHSQGVIHGRLTLANILFHDHGTNIGARIAHRVSESVLLSDVGIVDVGLAGPRSETGVEKSRSPSLPQELGGSVDSPDPSQDVVDAATILYELLTVGVPPTSTEAAERERNRFDYSPMPIQSIVPDVPDDVAVLLHAALTPEPAYRIQTSEEWATLLEDSLERLVNRVPVGKRIRTPSQYTLSDVAAGPARTTEQRWHHVRPMIPGARSMATYALVSVMLVAMLGLAYTASGWFVSDGDDIELVESNGSDAVSDEDGDERLDELLPTVTPGVPEFEPTETPLSESINPTPTPEATSIPIPETVIEDAREVLDGLPSGASAVLTFADGQSIETNPDRAIPAASLIKLWIAAAALEEASDGQFDVTETYTIQPGDQAYGTGVLNRPDFAGEEVTYLELIELMLLHSDNSAANIVTDRIGGRDRINQYAQENGFADTRMQRYLGALDPANENYTSARDTARFLEKLLDREIVSDVASEFLLDMLLFRPDFEADNLNFFGLSLPSHVTYGHLSGLLPGVRNEAGYIQGDDGVEELIIVILIDDLADGTTGEAIISEAVADIYALLP